MPHETQCQWMPLNVGLSAAVTVLLSTAVALATVALATLALGDYGYVLFLLLPFILGALVVLLHGARARRPHAG